MTGKPRSFAENLKLGRRLKVFSPFARLRVLANTTLGAPSISQLPVAARSKKSWIKPLHMLGSINVQPNSATIFHIPLAIYGVINMNLGIGVSNTPTFVIWRSNEQLFYYQHNWRVLWPIRPWILRRAPEFYFKLGDYHWCVLRMACMAFQRK